ncbi:MAG: DUF983 domain-containing protein [Alphaproteobacteria bacterium]|nr:DUF983 domain-containing protein [Alphaproteobacteria bacterium]
MSTQRFGYVSPYAAGLRCRCPRCGRGHLFEGLLSVRPICEVCELDLSAHDTGDGPAVFAIFLIGFIVVPLALAVDALFEPAFWVHIALWLPVVSLLAIAFLRPMKATLVALHYKNFKHHYGPG